jgi:hypothetical protein
MTTSGRIAHRRQPRPGCRAGARAAGAFGMPTVGLHLSACLWPQGSLGEKDRMRPGQGGG